MRRKTAVPILRELLDEYQDSPDGDVSQALKVAIDALEEHTACSCWWCGEPGGELVPEINRILHRSCGLLYQEKYGSG